MSNEKKKKQEIEDIFMYKFKNNLLLFLLMVGVGLIIWGMSLFSDIRSYDKKILAQKFFIYKINENYKSAKDIISDPKFGKIDVLTVDDLLTLLMYIKTDLQKNSISLDVFDLSTINWVKSTTQYLTIKIKAEFDSYQSAFKLLQKYLNANILTKKFSLTYNKWRWILDMNLQVYYKWKLSPNVLKQFKIQKKIKNKENIKNK